MNSSNPYPNGHYSNGLNSNSEKSIASIPVAFEPIQWSRQTLADFTHMDWSTFAIAERGAKPQAPRQIDTKDGIGDRLRAAAFAEIQARDAFLWATKTFGDAPDSLKAAWVKLALEEQKHMNWLLNRMKVLGIEVTERKVSDHLWLSFLKCKNAKDFSLYMATAEDRGRKAGERFSEAMKTYDPETGRIFGQIAFEERSHIELAISFYPELKAEIDRKSPK